MQYQNESLLQILKGFKVCQNPGSNIEELIKFSNESFHRSLAVLATQAVDFYSVLRCHLVFISLA